MASYLDLPKDHCHSMEDATSSSSGPNDEEETKRPCHEASKQDENDEAGYCPLFMDGLPADFSTNPNLAALASLMDDEENKKVSVSEAHEAITPRAGGGKLRRKPGRSFKRESEPYTRPAKSSKNGASIGEAHLFLKMWKL